MVQLGKLLHQFKTKEQQLQEANELLQQNKIEREQNFQSELIELCKKYSVSLSSQITITAN